MKTLIKNRIIRIVFISAVIILLMCTALILSKYVFIGKRLIPRNTDDLDLSGEMVNISKVLRFTSPKYIRLENCEISPDEFDILRKAFPDSELFWSIPLSSGPASNKSSELTLNSIVESDLPLFAYFENLATVHAEGIDEWTVLSALEQQYADIDFLWGITLNGKYYSAALTKLATNDPVDFHEINDKLRAFTQLESVSLRNDGLLTEEKMSLQESFPHISFYFTVEEFGQCFLNTADRLDFSNNDTIDIERLVYIAPLFKRVELIDFSGCHYSNDEMSRVIHAFPDADVLWEFQIYGKDITSLDQEIDFSGIQITDTSEIENSLPLLKKLNKIVMSDCGISDEEMDALDKRHINIRFVWTIFLGPARRGLPRYELRTDATYFISSLQLGEENAYKLTDDYAAPLKYCTDMIALDLGHNKITNCEFCRYMPKLRYFICAGCFQLEDISPLADCKELYYLELMFCPVSDLSPLLECKELRHINICACSTQDSIRSVLSQMTWLERCYMAGRTCYYQSDYSYVNSDDFLPNTEKWLLGLDFYQKWRSHPSYFEMRDALGGAYYMARKPK